MDFIDRLALLFEGKSAKAPGTNPVKIRQESRVIEAPIEKSVVEINPLEGQLSVDSHFELEQYSDLPDFEDINKKRDSFGDLFLQKNDVLSLNDTLCKREENLLQQRVDLSDKNILYKIFPYINAKMDVGSWVYKNRMGVIATMILYILILSAIMFVNLDIKGVDLSNSILIEVPLEEEPQKLEEKKPIEQNGDFNDQKVENLLVDKNVELDARLKDDRSTKTSDLYKEAYEVQSRLEASKTAYEAGLNELESIRREEKKADQPSEATRKSMNKEGNVTVSYDLKNRYVTRPEIPAYRCKGAGRVIIDVVVARNGRVLSASIKSLSGVDDECLPQMALEAARMTEFNMDDNAPEKQSGQISFMFVAQK